MAKDSKKPKGGWVYVGESKRSDGTKKHYVGSTTRDVKTREKEHKSEVRKKDSKTWVGKGSSYKTIGSFWSKNPRTDEKKVKAMSRSERKKLISSKKRTRSTTKKRAIKKKTSPKKVTFSNSGWTTDRYGRPRQKTAADYAKTRKSSTKKKTTKRKTTTKSKPKTSTKKRVTRKKSPTRKTTTTRSRSTRKAPPRRRTYRSRRR